MAAGAGEHVQVGHDRQGRRAGQGLLVAVPGDRGPERRVAVHRRRRGHGQVRPAELVGGPLDEVVERPEPTATGTASWTARASRSRSTLPYSAYTKVPGGNRYGSAVARPAASRPPLDPLARHPPGGLVGDHHRRPVAGAPGDHLGDGGGAPGPITTSRVSVASFRAERIRPSSMPPRWRVSTAFIFSTLGADLPPRTPRPASAPAPARPPGGHPRPHGQHLGVVGLAGPLGRVGVVGGGRPHPGDLVGGDGHAQPGAADQQGPVVLAAATASATSAATSG